MTFVDCLLPVTCALPQIPPEEPKPLQSAGQSDVIHLHQEAIQLWENEVALYQKGAYNAESCVYMNVLSLLHAEWWAATLNYGCFREGFEYVLAT